MAVAIIITCEHGGNQIPLRFRTAFSLEDVGTIEEAWDPGALDMALSLSQLLDVPCFSHQTSHALVNVNHSLGHEQLFSLASARLSDADKQLILERYYFPYRLRVESAIAMAEKPVLHISIHTVTEGAFDMMLYYRSDRSLEMETATKLHALLSSANDTISYRLHDQANAEHDSFIKYLRTRFQEEEYAGLTFVVKSTLAEETMDLLISDLASALNALRT